MDLKQSYYEIYGKNENTDLRYTQLLNIRINQEMIGIYLRK